MMWHFAVGMLPTARWMEERGCCGSACPSPPSASRLGKAEVGRGAAWSPGRGRGGGKGEGGAGRDGPSLLPLLLLLEPVKLHSRFPQELPFHLPAPGACKTASVCLRRLSSPCAPPPPPPRPTPAESPRTGAPRARPGSRGLVLPETGEGGNTG